MSEQPQACDDHSSEGIMSEQDLAALRRQCATERRWADYWHAEWRAKARRGDQLTDDVRWYKRWAWCWMVTAIAMWVMFVVEAFR